MPKYRLQRRSPATQAGMSGGEIEERVIELPAGMSPRPGSEVVPDNTLITEWAPKPPESPQDEE